MELLKVCPIFFVKQKKKFCCWRDNCTERSCSAKWWRYILLPFLLVYFTCTVLCLQDGFLIFIINSCIMELYLHVYLYVFLFLFVSINLNVDEFNCWIIDNCMTQIKFDPPFKCITFLYMSWNLSKSNIGNANECVYPIYATMSQSTTLDLDVSCDSLDILLFVHLHSSTTNLYFIDRVFNKP